MSEANCETRILATVRALTNFSSTNAVAVDFGVLSSGKSDHYMVMIPGESEVEQIAPTTYLTHRTFMLQVWQRYKGLDSAVKTSLAARQDELAAGIMAVPRLGDTSNTIVDSTVETGAQPEEMLGPATTRRNAPMVKQWLRGELVVKVTEEKRL
jgi:hypothetical protein